MRRVIRRLPFSRGRRSRTRASSGIRFVGHFSYLRGIVGKTTADAPQTGDALLDPVTPHRAWLPTFVPGSRSAGGYQAGLTSAGKVEGVRARSRKFRLFSG